MLSNKSVMKQKHVSFGAVYIVKCFDIMDAGISAAK
jgi:hypothetical protein